VTLVENFAQTLGVLSPAGTISIIIPLLIASAGNGTWLLLLGTLSIFLFVMLSVLRFASLHASAGSLATFARLGLGRRGGVWGGWVYLFGISYCIPSAILGAALYLDFLLSTWLGPATTLLRVVLLTVLLTGAAWFAAFRGVKLSTHLMLAIEGASLTLIFGCMAPLSLMYLLATYCMVSLGNRGLISGETSGLTVPFDDLARALGLPWLGPLSSLGVALSYFACALGCLTVASRVLFSMAREGEFWRSFGEAHPRSATPHRAIALIALLSMAIPVGMLVGGEEIGIAFNFLVQLGSIGIIGGYLFVAIALPCYLKRRRLLRRRDVTVAGLAGALLVLVLYLSVYPTPPRPYSFVVWAFLVSVVAGVAVTARLRGRSAAGRIRAGMDDAAA
jgi:amino acid transporter